MAQEICASDPLYAVAPEAAEWLRDKTGETALCGRVEDGVVKVQAFTEGRHPLRYMQSVGSRLSLHVTALGKAVLALGTPEAAARQLRLKPLRKIAKGSIVDLAALEAQVAQARAQGWIWVENESCNGLAALAVAGYPGHAGHADTEPLAGPGDRLRPQRESLLAALQQVQALVFRPRKAREPVAA